MTSPITSRDQLPTRAPVEPGSTRPAGEEPVTGGSDTDAGANTASEPGATYEPALDEALEPAARFGPPERGVPSEMATDALAAASRMREIVANEPALEGSRPVGLDTVKQRIAEATPKEQATVQDFERLGVSSADDIAFLRLYDFSPEDMALMYNGDISRYQAPDGAALLEAELAEALSPTDKPSGWDAGWASAFSERARTLGFSPDEADAIAVTVKMQAGAVTDAELQDTLEQLTRSVLDSRQAAQVGVTDESLAHAAAAGPGWNDKWATLLRTEFTDGGLSSAQSMRLLREFKYTNPSTERLETVVRQLATADGKQTLANTAATLQPYGPADTVQTALVALGVVGAGALTVHVSNQVALRRQLATAVANVGPERAASFARAMRRPSADVSRASILQARAETRSALLTKAMVHTAIGDQKGAAGARRAAAILAPRTPITPTGALRWIVGMPGKAGATQAGLGAFQRVLNHTTGPLLVAGAAALGIATIVDTRRVEGSDGPETAKSKGDTIGSLGAGIAGVATGASIGSRLPGGALLGGLVGGIVGSTAGSLAGIAIAEGMHANANEQSSRSDD